MISGKITVVGEFQDNEQFATMTDTLEGIADLTSPNVVVTSSIDTGPDEDACLYVESSDFLNDVHPEACWYTIKATPSERIEHYIRRSPPCEAFDCEGFNAGGKWFDCYGPIGPNHEHYSLDVAAAKFKDGKA